MMATAAAEHGVAIHGYVLMTTHYHAQVTGFDADSLPGMMQNLGRGYVRYFNDRHRRTGTLWEGRYQSSLILDERYWLTCLRYVEVNPVRARMVDLPGDYQWSSHQANALGAEDPLLTQHTLYLQLAGHPKTRAECWAQLCGQPLTERETARIREALRRNREIGPED